MTPAEELRAAAVSLRSKAAADPLNHPLAAWLEDAARDSEEIGTDYYALAVARVINGGAS